MIPNAGLDNIAAYAPWGSAPGTGLAGSTNDATGSQWLAYAAISEDSTAPSASDTNIGTEKMRTNSTGGFSRSSSAIRDGASNLLGVTIERAYVFDITSSMNLTKYGYVPVSSGGNFSWIDLFREDPNDPLSDPVTITVGNGDQLQLWQTLTITVPWSVDLESFVVTGTTGNDGSGTHDAYCGFYATGSAMDNTVTTQSLSNMIRHTFWPTSNLGPAAASKQTVSAARDAKLASSAMDESVSAAPTLATYTPGDYYRDKVYKWTTAQANMTITGIALLGITGVSARSTNDYGFKIVWDDPSTFTKDGVHELTLTFRVSWAEA